LTDLSPIILAAPDDASGNFDPYYYRAKDIATLLNCRVLPTSKEEYELQTAPGDYEAGYDVIVNQEERSIRFTDQGLDTIESHCARLRAASSNSSDGAIPTVCGWDWSKMP